MGDIKYELIILIWPWILRYKMKYQKKNIVTLLFFFTWEKLIREETFKSVMYGFSL